MITWQVILPGGKRFTFITEFCKTEEEVAAAIFEKMCKKIEGAVRL